MNDNRLGDIVEVNTLVGDNMVVRNENQQTNKQTTQKKTINGRRQMKNKSEPTTMTSFSMFFANWYSVCWFFFGIFLLYLFYSIFTCLLHLRLLCSHLFRLLYKFLLLLFCFCFVFWCHSFRLMRFCGFCSASYIYLSSLLFCVIAFCYRRFYGLYVLLLVCLSHTFPFPAARLDSL